MFANIVVGVDRSSPSEGMLACIDGLRGVGAREVLLVHALEGRPPDDEKQVLASVVEPRLASLRGAIERMGLVASAEIAPGIAASELARIARERSASLIVLGAESSRARELLLGSVEIQVLHRASLPVLVPGAAPSRARRAGAEAARADLRTHVLYATDFDAAAERALGFVEQLVREGARRVTLVRVHAPPRRKRLEHLAKRLLLVGAADVRIETPAGVPEHEIVRLARELEASLVVMGTRGRGPAGTLSLGSVSHGVARESRAPVLLVPPDRASSR